MPLINALLDRVRNEFSKPDVIWKKEQVGREDLEFLKKECMKDSDFDLLNKRKTMYDKMIQKQAHLLFYKCKYGQILTICEDDQINQIPWSLWGRILRMFYEGKKFKVFFLAHKSPRVFPKGEITPENINAEFSITPENINGGYTYQCNPETIVIYRAEDATRVLIHEIQHALCLDKHENGVDAVEAETEAWAELIYIGILSGGKKCIFDDMLNRQSEWIVKQNAKVKKHMKHMEFPWRYTVGKEEVWRRWNILTNFKSSLKVNSLRLTFPPNDLLKQRFNVSSDSNIL